MIPRSGGCYLLARKGQKIKICCNDFDATEFFSPGYLFVANVTELGKLKVSKGSHHYIIYPAACKKQLARAIKKESIDFFLLSVEETNISNTQVGNILENITCATICILCQPLYQLKMQHANYIMNHLRFTQRLLRQVPKMKPRKSMFHVSPLYGSYVG